MEQTVHGIGTPHHWIGVWRHISHNRAYVLNSVAGLAIGFTFFMLGFAYVQQELSYDRWIDDADRVYRARFTSVGSAGQSEAHNFSLSPSTAATLEEQVPAIKSAGLLGQRLVKSIVFDRTALSPDSIGALFAVTPGFLDMYPLRFVAGNRKALFLNPNAIAVSARYAQETLSGIDPVGRTLTINEREREIIAVYEAYPLTTHARPDLLTPITPADEGGPLYVKLTEGADFQAARDAIENVVLSALGVTFGVETENMALDLRPVTSLHLDNSEVRGRTSKGSRGQVIGIAIVSMVVLMLTTLNFIALNLVQAVRRTREASLRKLFGASFGELVRLYVGPSILTAFLALAIGLFAYVLLLPLFIAYVNAGAPDSQLPAQLRAAGFQLQGSPVGFARMLAAVAAATAIGVVAGIYPALSAARLRPGDNFSAAGSAVPLRDLRFQRGIGIAQRITAVISVSGVLVVTLQSAHVASFDRGFDPQDTVELHHFTAAGGDYSSWSQASAAAGRFALRALEMPGVASAGLFWGPTIPQLGGRNANASIVNPLNGAENRAVIADVSTGYLDTMRARALAGHAFTGTGYGFEDASRGAREGDAVLTEDLAWGLGFADARDAIGKNIQITASRGGQQRIAPVVGVIESVRPTARQEQSVPAVFNWRPSVSPMVALRVDPHLWPELEPQLHEMLSDVIPITLFSSMLITSSNEVLARELGPSLRIRATFAIGAAIALLIAGMGIYGAAAFETERRRGEMAIRRVLGATRIDVLRLLVLESAVQTGIAFVIALPIAWYLLDAWLEKFGARIDLAPTPFAIAGLIVLLFSLVAASRQFRRLVVARPADSLRYE